MSKRKLVLSFITVAVIGLGIFNLNPVYAQTNSSTPKNPFASLVDLIVQKFGLDKNQVQSVVDQYQTDQKQKREENMSKQKENRLDKLVKDGKITEAQKQAILKEIADLKNKYNPANFNKMTQAERKQQFQSEQDEIKTWTSTQGIDPSYVMPGFGMGFRGGMHKMKKW